MLSRRWSRTILASSGNPIHSLIFFSSAERKSKPSSTIATVLAESETIRLIRSTMPLALYCSPYVALVLRNYSTMQYYDSLIRLLEASTSMTISARRAVLRDGVLIKLTRLAQTIAIRRDIAEMREIRDALRVDRRMQAFHEGRRLDVPDIYRRHLSKRLGRFGELLTAADLVPVFASNRSFQRATTRSGMVVASSRSAERPA